MHKVWVVTLVVLTTIGFSGCADLLKGLTGGEDQSPQASRIIEMFLDEDKFEEMERLDDDDMDAILAALMDVRFDYRHGGPAIDTADATVTFQDEDGATRTRDLSDFTSKTSLSDGDVVPIDGVHATSSLQVKHGNTVLVQRGGLDRDWLEADGYPLPIAAKDGARAKYITESTGGLDFSIEGLSYDDGWSSMELKEASAKLEVGQDGSLELSMDRGDLEMRYEATGDMTGSFDMDASADGESVQAEASADADWDLDGRVILGFDDGSLESAGAGGSVLMDANYETRFTMGGQTETDDSRGMPHPLVDESFPFTSEDIPASGEPVDRMIVAKLRTLYGMDLAVGDRVAMEISMSESGLDFGSASFSVEVAGTDTRSVDGQSLETLRIIERFEVRSEVTPDFESLEITYWIDKASYLPVFVEFEHSETLTERDIDELFGPLAAMAGEEIPMPDDMRFVMSTKSTVRLSEYDAGMALPGLVSMQGMSTIVMAGAMFALVSDLGYDDPYGYEYEEAYEATPNVQFTKDETNDRLKVVRADSSADWGRITLISEAEYLNVELNGESDMDSRSLDYVSLPGGSIMAGDYLDLCNTDGELGDTVSVIDDRSNAVIGEFTFASLAAC